MDNPLPHRKITTSRTGEKSVRRPPWLGQSPLMKLIRKVLLGKSDKARLWEVMGTKKMMATRRKM